MIEAWIDEDNGEVFFCIGGRIDLHTSSGTVSKNARKIADYNTNSMSEAHKIFQESLQEQGTDVEENSLQEGWD